jgi:hypothetical protein
MRCPKCEEDILERNVDIDLTDDCLLIIITCQKCITTFSNDLFPEELEEEF